MYICQYTMEYLKTFYNQVQDIWKILLYQYGGKGTHAVLSGHTGLVRTKIFDDINKLEIGDKFYIDVLGEKLTYEVDKIDVVLPDNTDTLKVEPDKDYITLLTCTPYMINSHRLLVRGSRVSFIEQPNESESQIDTSEPINPEELDIENLKESKIMNIAISVMVCIIVIIILIIYIFGEKKKIYRRRKR